MKLQRVAGHNVQIDAVTGELVKDGSILPNDMDLSTMSAFKAVPTAEQSIVANTWTKLTLPEVTYDNQTEYDRTSFRFVAKTKGTYLVSMRARAKSTSLISSDDLAVSMALFRNGSVYSKGNSHTVKLNQGEYIECFILVGSDAVVNSSISETNFSALKVL